MDKLPRHRVKPNHSHTNLRAASKGGITNMKEEYTLFKYFHGGLDKESLKYICILISYNTFYITLFGLWFGIGKKD